MSHACKRKQEEKEMTMKDIRKTEAYKLNVELEEFIKPNGEELSPEEEEKVCDMEVVQINKSKEQAGAYEFVVIPECEVYDFLENEDRKKKIKEHLDSLNLNDYDLGGVEITEEDIEDIVLIGAALSVYFIINALLALVEPNVSVYKSFVQFYRIENRTEYVCFTVFTGIFTYIFLAMVITFNVFKRLNRDVKEEYKED